MPITINRLARLNEAFDLFVQDNEGEGAWAYANDYREEGYRLGEQAFDMTEDDRWDWIDVEVCAFPEDARYMIACAAAVRLEELAADEVRSFFPVAADVLEGV